VPRTTRTRKIPLILFVSASAGAMEQPQLPRQSAPAVREPARPEESQGESARASASPQSLGFIDTASSHCYQPNPARNECYINWLYHQVASSTYLKFLRVAIDGRVVSNAQGFFQNNLYLPQQMSGNGFRVACSTLGSGGVTPRWAAPTVSRFRPKISTA
jgi:hypothetical protein